MPGSTLTGLDSVILALAMGGRSDITLGTAGQKPVAEVGKAVGLSPQIIDAFGISGFARPANLTNLVGGLGLK